METAPVEELVGNQRMGARDAEPRCPASTNSMHRISMTPLDTSSAGRAAGRAWGLDRSPVVAGGDLLGLHVVRGFFRHFHAAAISDDLVGDRGARRSGRDPGAAERDVPGPRVRGLRRRFDAFGVDDRGPDRAIAIAIVVDLGSRRGPAGGPGRHGFVTEAIAGSRFRRLDGNPRSRTVDDRFRGRARGRAFAWRRTARIELGRQLNGPNRHLSRWNDDTEPEFP